MSCEGSGILCMSCEGSGTLCLVEGLCYTLSHLGLCLGSEGVQVLCGWEHT